MTSFMRVPVAIHDEYYMLTRVTLSLSQSILVTLMNGDAFVQAKGIRDDDYIHAGDPSGDVPTWVNGKMGRSPNQERADAAAAYALLNPRDPCISRGDVPPGGGASRGFAPGFASRSVARSLNQERADAAAGVAAERQAQGRGIGGAGGNPVAGARVLVPSVDNFK